MIYSELENLRAVHDIEVCLFGGGYYGKTRGYDCVIALGFKVDFYCDNNIAPGTIIRDDIEVRDIQYLYEHKDRIQVFLTARYCHQQPIIDQLKEHGIENILVIDRVSISQLLDSIDSSDDEMIKQRYHAFYNDVEYLEKRFALKVGYKLDIDNPKTFNEKLQWLKLYDRNPEYTRMVDKYEAKQFVKERIGVGYTILTLGVWNSFDEIDFDKLPEQFVLKCTHDSGSAVIVDDKNNFNKEEARRILCRALDENFFWRYREWPYKNVKRRIIAEPYMKDNATHELRDYKFFTFDGKARAMYVASERGGSTETKFDFFDMNYKHLPFTNGHPNAAVLPKKPENFAQMIQLAECLSVGIPHVRVDFYEVDGKMYFGEFTFYHLGGMVPFNPSSWDEKFGSWLTLEADKWNK